MSKSVLVVAGEISGDLHAAQVVRSIQEHAPDTTFFGVGGDALEATGMEVKYHVRDMAVLGLSEVLRRYAFFRGVFADLLKLCKERRPDAVLLIDYPGFNLRFARRVHAMGIKVIYYVCPQVWAWHKSRKQLMARIVDRLIVIFPFEKDVFADTGLRVDFAGHPLVDEARAFLTSPEGPLPWGDGMRVAILPGSRKQELQRHMPVLCAAAKRLERSIAGVSFVVAAPSDEIAAMAQEMIMDADERPRRMEVVVHQTREVLRQARAAWVASGTATIDAALMGCPMVILYKTARMTYAVGKALVHIPHIGMVNVVARREVCPEFIQHEATPDALSNALEPLVSETSERRVMMEGLNEVRSALGPGGAGEHAARIVLDELGL